MSEEQFDALLLSIASRTRGIDDLLDVFLGFMRRKSDAFNPPGGYPQLEAAFVAALKRQYDVAEAERAKKSRTASDATGRPAPAASAASAAKPAAGRTPPATTRAPPAATPTADAVLEPTADGVFDVSGAASAAVAGAAAAPRPAAPAATAAVPSAAVVPPATAQAAVAAATPAADSGVTVVAADEAAPERPPLGNGGATDRYTWTQTLGDVTIVFAVPPATRSRDVRVDIRSKHVSVALLGAPTTTLLDGVLPKRVKAEDSYWTLGAERAGPRTSGRAGPRARRTLR